MVFGAIIRSMMNYASQGILHRNPISKIGSLRGIRASSTEYYPKIDYKVLNEVIEKRREACRKSGVPLTDFTISETIIGEVIKQVQQQLKKPQALPQFESRVQATLRYDEPDNL